MDSAGQGAQAVIRLDLGRTARHPALYRLRTVLFGHSHPLGTPDLGPKPLRPPDGMATEALELVPDAVVIVRAAQGAAGLRVVSANRAARSLLRLQQAGDNLVSALRHAEVLDALEDSLAHGAEHEFSYAAGGSPAQHWRVWTRPLPDAPGGPLLMLVIRDDTGARRSERLRVDFLANASHELRTPLASLAGFIETLRGHAREDAAARERFLEIMAVQAGRMRSLLDDLLALSRIELNEHVPPAGRCDLGALATEAAAGLEAALAAKSVKVCFASPAPGPIEVIGDRDQLSQVVNNLLDNAAKFSPEGAPLHLELAGPGPFAPLTDSRFTPETSRFALVSPERAHETAYVRMTVRNTGHGIAREHLPRLAERFYRVPGQKAGSGTGLGLAIVKHIVNRHRGGLVVESAPASGTAFSVYVPAARHESFAEA